MPGGPEEELRQLRARAVKALPEFIGLRTEAAVGLARRLGLELRVIQISENEWFTSDDRSNRITVEVENGVVTGARAT
jgi:hypothetical protein